MENSDINYNDDKGDCNLFIIFYVVYFLENKMLTLKVFSTRILTFEN